MRHDDDSTYQFLLWKRFYRRPLGRIALGIIALFILVGIYAPFLASGKPLIVQYDGAWYFPLFRYLFYPGYYTKPLDLFFNLLMFTLPIACAGCACCLHWFKSMRTCTWLLAATACVHIAIFLYFIFNPIQDPAFNLALSTARQQALAGQTERIPSWEFDLHLMTPYARLNLALNHQRKMQQQSRLEGSLHSNAAGTLWQLDRANDMREIARLEKILEIEPHNTPAFTNAQNALAYITDRAHWLAAQLPLLKYQIMPLVRPFHWEEDAGGDQKLNALVSYWELTRINRKDLTAALIFGVRISMVVGLLSIALALAIGLPIGAFAGYHGGIADIAVSRLLEVWEAMPTFFMLLMVIALLQSKSIFLVIAIIGLFGWTGFSRYMRGEVFKQRHLPYIEACRAQGLSNRKIIFSHIFPNAIPPIITLLPFAIMGAISSEAGLSFLGLGEEGSCSWGVLMDEGRSVFPHESYLLWPPAILLTLLLVAIAIVGDVLRDALDQHDAAPVVALSGYMHHVFRLNDLVELFARQ